MRVSYETGGTERNKMTKTKVRRLLFPLLFRANVRQAVWLLFYTGWLKDAFVLLTLRWLKFSGCFTYT